jgi:uncharacterized protein
MSSQYKPNSGTVASQQGLAQKPPAWWKNPYCWLVLIGPITVIFAGLITVWIAVDGADPVIDANYYQKGLALSKGASPDTSALLPARQARNHAATGGTPSGILGK